MFSFLRHIDKNRIHDETILIRSNEKKQTRNKLVKESYRGSKYRGVSINGLKWQIFIIIKNKKHYAGQLDSEEDAAKLYDKLIIMHNGLVAKTNFNYSVQEIKEIAQILLEDRFDIEF